MKYLLTCLALGLAFAAGAQTWNPDVDSNNAITVEDLVSLLSVFGLEWMDSANILTIDSLDYTEASLHIVTLADGSFRVSPIWNIEVSEETDVIFITDLEYPQSTFVDYASGFLPSGPEIIAESGEVQIELPQNALLKSMIVGFDDSTPPSQCVYQTGDYLSVQFNSGIQNDIIDETFHCIENDAAIGSFVSLLRLNNRWLVNGARGW